MKATPVLFALTFGICGPVAVGQRPAPPPASAAHDAGVPDTPAGRRVRALLATLESPDEASVRRFVETQFDSAALAELPAEKRVERIRGMAATLGRLEWIRMLPARGGAVSFLARSVKTGETLTVSLELAGSGARGIRSMRVEAEGPGEAREGSPAEDAKSSDAEVASAAGEWLDRLASADQFSGVVLLARNGSPFFQKAYGFANRELQVPNTLDTRFNVASIGKLFTSAAIAGLVHDGRLSYSDTVAKWLPSTKIPSADRITVAQLLDMTSGLGDIFGPAYSATPKDRIQELSDYLALFETRPLLFEPGKGREYSNAGYVVLGLIIEKVTGKNYREFVREAVFLPAGMNDTGLFATDEITPRRAVGYTRHLGGGSGSSDARHSNVFLQPGRGSSAGGGFSTAGDLLKFAMAVKKGALSLAEPGRPPGGRSAAGGFAGGAPGSNALLEYNADGSLVAIVLANEDPPLAVKTGSRLARWMGMKSAGESPTAARGK
ncbi:MAG: beta-lactamase family protein [Acidobacteria bacterium]|nr:beta-lactamase family protein [Acidobacteriota bacterium]MCA1611386.1 beta-lactamase family protein [Acidobacteriota bacterium]